MRRKQEPIGEEYVEFGAMIKLLRQARNLTQEQLSEIMGISKTSVVNYETGTRKIPLSLIKKFSEYFGVSIDALLGLRINTGLNAEQISRWREEFGSEYFSEDEFDELMQYGKYILHRRDK